MRTYGQYCAVARALDIVGERWTLLIVRELVLSPKRYGDLLGALPGIGRNLLTTRLRRLEQEGLVQRRRLPPPAGSRVYELTADGRGLAPALASLARWGAERLGTPDPVQRFRAEWLAIVIAVIADRDAARGVHETYEFRVDGHAFHVRVDDGTIDPQIGHAEDPDLVVTTDAATVIGIVSGRRFESEPLLEVDGSPRSFERCLKIFATRARVGGLATLA